MIRTKKLIATIGFISIVSSIFANQVFAQISPDVSIEFKQQKTESSPWEPTKLNQTHITDVTVDQPDYALNQHYITLHFNKEGQELFAQITKENIGKQLAIFINEELISAPTIQSEITGGEAIITGGFSLIEANQLANKIKFGPNGQPQEENYNLEETRSNNNSPKTQLFLPYLLQIFFAYLL